MEKWMSLPTWLLTNLVTPFMPKGHPWHRRYFTLEDWAECQTPMCQEYDFGLWCGFIMIFVFSFL